MNNTFFIHIFTFLLNTETTLSQGDSCQPEFAAGTPNAEIKKIAQMHELHCFIILLYTVV